MADGDYAFDAQLHRCLVDRKRLDSFVDAEHLMKAECGNGKIDAGEQCENMASGCCTDKCLLKAGAQCYEGPCCESNLKGNLTIYLCAETKLCNSTETTDEPTATIIRIGNFQRGIFSLFMWPAQILT